MSAAVSPSSAEARMATPQLEYLNATKNSAISTPATIMAINRFWVIPMPPMRTDSPPHGCGTLRMSGPIRRISSVSRMMSTPMVTIARLITGAPRSRLMMTRSTASAASAVIPSPASTAPRKPSGSDSRAIAYAPSSSREPWVKLTTSLALKMITKPSAISA
jgi:hypothetical protein